MGHSVYIQRCYAVSAPDTFVLKAMLAQAVAWVKRSSHRAGCPLAWLAANHSGYLHKCTCGKAEIELMLDSITDEATVTPESADAAREGK